VSVILRGTTIQVVVLACRGGSRRMIGVTRGTIDNLAAAAITPSSMLGRFECVTDPIAVRNPLS
jgi:hypothetical protein